jgi:hypothetical protein
MKDINVWKHTSILRGDGMCMGKITIRCPQCSSKLEVTRPDSLHPYWAFEKPSTKETKSQVIEETYICKNQSCQAKFTVYWYEAELLLDRV